MWKAIKCLAEVELKDYTSILAYDLINKRFRCNCMDGVDHSPISIMKKCVGGDNWQCGMHKVKGLFGLDTSLSNAFFHMLCCLAISSLVCNMHIPSIYLHQHPFLHSIPIFKTKLPKPCLSQLAAIYFILSQLDHIASNNKIISLQPSSTLYHFYFIYPYQIT